ncbi:MAG: hypothetical protein P1V97_05415 [Planctomycetota bacterium]|nr:hypothetical protein [Planctomycetota bacterium]
MNKSARKGEDKAQEAEAEDDDGHFWLFVLVGLLGLGIYGASSTSDLPYRLVYGFSYGLLGGILGAYLATTVHAVSEAGGWLKSWRVGRLGLLPGAFIGLVTEAATSLPSSSHLDFVIPIEDRFIHTAFYLTSGALVGFLGAVTWYNEDQKGFKALTATNLLVSGLVILAFWGATLPRSFRESERLRTEYLPGAKLPQEAEDPLTSTDPEARMGAAVKAVESGLVSDKLLSVLRGELRSADWRTRASAARLLGKLKNDAKPAIEELIQLCEDGLSLSKATAKDPSEMDKTMAIREAITTLAGLGVEAKDAIPVLLKLKQRVSFRVPAKKALAAIQE